MMKHSSPTPLGSLPDEKRPEHARALRLQAQLLALNALFEASRESADPHDRGRMLDFLSEAAPLADPRSTWSDENDGWRMDAARILRAEKLEHLSWKARLQEAVRNRRTPSEEESESITRPSFGHWCEHIGRPRYGHLLAYSGMESAHRHARLVGMEVASNLSKGNFHTAAIRMEDLEQHSRELVSLLEEMTQEI